MSPSAQIFGVRASWAPWSLRLCHNLRTPLLYWLCNCRCIQ